ncbi:MAG TPA: hypothetical protein VFV68_07340 [Agriterribacter sp.]|nr:hypothetical protein [Agriterribacter sp.]
MHLLNNGRHGKNLVKYHLAIGIWWQQLLVPISVVLWRFSVSFFALLNLKLTSNWLGGSPFSRLNSFLKEEYPMGTQVGGNPVSVERMGNKD